MIEYKILFLRNLAQIEHRKHWHQYQQQSLPHFPADIFAINHQRSQGHSQRGGRK